MHDAHRQGTVVVRDLTLRLEEAQEALSAIRNGEVDALVVANGEASPRVFLIEGADQAHRILFETLNEGATTLASDGTILRANRRLAELLGAPMERLLGARLGEFIGPESAGIFAALLDRARSGASKGEVTLAARTGGAVPVMMSMAAVDEGDDATFTAVMTDLSPLKEAQLALRRANDELEARVAARTEELARVNEALRAEIAERTRLEHELRRRAEELGEADRRKDEFLSMLAHELRNPLAPIVTALEILRPMARATPALERYRGVIERQTRNLTRLVDDLLDVSRITRRAVTLRPQLVDLAAVVESAVDAARPLIEARRHHLEVALPGPPIPARVDPTRFEQVLVNLLNNAAKYTEPGGRIALSIEREGAELRVSVRDDGIGMPADLLPLVFDLFVQGERSLDRSQGGLGIGLTLVKSLVEMHGGRVEARSEGPGRGSEIHVRIPAEREGAHAGTAAPAAEEAVHPRTVGRGGRPR